MRSLPSGTVTFLFTDIEGSASLAQSYPDDLPALLARHDAILHDLIASHDGYVFKTVGDAFCAAFATAGDGLAAALAAQRALQDEPWEVAPILVRMGLHTGTAQTVAIEDQPGDYAGYLTLTRAQRVMSAGHGGQVLLSSATAELLRGALPTGISLRSLGEHRLKGLLNPEHLWQLVAQGLREEFPPLATLNAIPNNLPIQLTRFIGRERETGEVGRLLETARLLTLTGSGGAGKTRLSLEVAADVLDGFRDGVWFVELAPLSNADLIAGTITAVLGLRDEQGRLQIETLLRYLNGKQLLLILDNCEHLIDGCARIADVILRASRDVRIMATSREALGIAGERTWRVPSLAAPDPRAALPVEQLEQYGAVQLFIARATYAQEDFRVTSSNAPAIAQICWRLDGIPLAIELAAARLRILTAEQIAARLDDRFRLLTAGGRTALPRHQTLGALVDWSYALLTATEQALFCSLSVFAGGWTLEAAEGVCACEGVDALDVLDLLGRLVDKSLVTVNDRGGQTRYAMLETIRQYASGKLRDAATAERVHRQHYDYFWGRARSANEQRGAERARHFDLLEAEHDNLAAALRGALAGNQIEEALVLCNTLWPLWSGRGYWTESRMWYGQALAASKQQQVRATVTTAHRAAYAEALDDSGTLAYWQGDFVTAQQQLEEALAAKRELGDKAGTASVLYSLGGTAWYQDDGQAAQSCWEESLALYREVDDKTEIAGLLWSLAMLAKERGEYREAVSLAKESAELSRAINDLSHAGWAIEQLGWLAMLEGDYDQCERYVTESHGLRQAANLSLGLAMSFGQMGYLYWHKADYAAARGAFTEELALLRLLEASSFTMNLCLIGFAAVDVSEGSLVRGTQLLGAIEAESQRTGRTPKDMFRIVQDKALAAAKAQLQTGDFDAAWSSGCALTMSQAAELARAECPSEPGMRM